MQFTHSELLGDLCRSIEHRDMLCSQCVLFALRNVLVGRWVDGYIMEPLNCFAHQNTILKLFEISVDSSAFREVFRDPRCFLHMKALRLNTTVDISGLYTYPISY